MKVTVTRRQCFQVQQEIFFFYEFVCCFTTIYSKIFLVYNCQNRDGRKLDRSQVKPIIIIITLYISIQRHSESAIMLDLLIVPIYHNTKCQQMSSEELFRFRSWISKIYFDIDYTTPTRYECNQSRDLQ